jgi:hypothetical protein
MSAQSDYLAIPADVDASSARVWVGSRVEPPPDGVWLEHDNSGARWPMGAWQRWEVPDEPGRFIEYQRVLLDGLQPDTEYPLTLRVAGEIRARAEITTLPPALPPVASRPFTIMLGSCFSRQQDDIGRVGQTFATLPRDAKPRLKFLVGDQVYLDSPWYRFLLPHSARDLGTGFLEHYLRTWGQHGDVQGFNLVLRTGANYFCADDHEFWNNAPFPCTYAVNTWTVRGRDVWWEQAIALFRAFQTDLPAQVDVGSLSIRVLDTRVNRQPDRSTFVTPEEMTALQRWVSGLAAPGILVIGQPIFATRTGLAGRFVDRNLPDFEQYAELCRVLQSSRQSILVLTGDAHYGRVATAPLAAGAELVELISSPLALVERSLGGSWHAAPAWFPAEAIPGIRRLPVTTNPNWKPVSNHFVTIELNDRAGGLSIRARAWETEPASGMADGVLVFNRILRRVP